ncbi:hypothetical protein [Rarobacter faecitabidus]|nr:hypothetical protein [Rarobacter faecitabidus]
MGYFVYGMVAEYEFEDRMLAHLKVAIGLKLRHHESFFVSWSNPVEKGSGRISLWVSPSIPLIFRFAGSRPPEINATWVNVLRDLSQSSRGLVVISEQEAEAYARQQAKSESNLPSGTA